MPTVSVPGFCAPFSLPFVSFTPAACNSSHAVVGVRSSNENDRSGRTVTRAGIGTPVVIWAVLALNSYHQIISTAPAWPSSLSYFAEIHAFDTFATKCWAHGRTGTCLPSSYDELHNLVLGWHFLRHLCGVVSVESRSVSKRICNEATFR